MTVAEFIKLDGAGTMFRVVDANIAGYRNGGKVIIEADKNVMKDLFGHNNLVGFEIATKRAMILYVNIDKEVK